MSILPKTSLGRWSVCLAAVIVLLSVLTPVLVYRSGLELEPGSVGLMALAAAFGISGVGALVTGLISIIKSKERSILVFLALAVGLFALIAATDMMFERV